MAMIDLQGRVAVVTGATGNLGQAVARAFLDHGARVALVGRSAERLTACYGGASERQILVTADLTREDEATAMAQRTVADFGRIDILANIAGGFTMGPRLHETDAQDWERMLDINARTMFLASRACLPHMLAQRQGRIVSVSARAAREGKPRMGPYCAAKSAVIRLTETMAAEYRDDGITANCILPGTIDTPENRRAMPDADFSRWVPPGDLASVILFLASDAARSVTGAAIPVYGRS